MTKESRLVWLELSATRAEADRRIAALTAKLKLFDEPPHTL
jgi:hypothetical protein